MSISPENRIDGRAALVIILLALSLPGCARRFDNFAELAKYDVVWDHPGNGSKGSMPAGIGDISLNVWAEEGSGSVCFYIGKTDSWDESGRLLKVGRVRVKVEPNPFGGGRAFSQRLNLREAAVEVAAGDSRSAVPEPSLRASRDPRVRLPPCRPERELVQSAFPDHCRACAQPVGTEGATDYRRRAIAHRN